MNNNLPRGGVLDPIWYSPPPTPAVSLRDYFAAHAPAEFLGEEIPKTTAECALMAIRARVKAAYAYADAMLAARGA